MKLGDRAAYKPLGEVFEQVEWGSIGVVVEVLLEPLLEGEEGVYDVQFANDVFCICFDDELEVVQ